MPWGHKGLDYLVIGFTKGDGWDDKDNHDSRYCTIEVSELPGNAFTDNYWLFCNILALPVIIAPIITDYYAFTDNISVAF